MNTQVETSLTSLLLPSSLPLSLAPSALQETPGQIVFNSAKFVV